MSDEKFKLPVSSYDELVKFIKAYSLVTKPTELSEISQMTGAAVPIISGNVGFFVATGILEGGKKKMATPKGQQLGQALEHNISDEIGKLWHSIVEENEFLTKLITSVRIRKGMDSQTLESHIAYSAGQPKKGRFMTGARTVIDILKVAELIIEIDGKYMPKEPTRLPESHIGSLIKNDNLEEQPTTFHQSPLTHTGFPLKTQKDFKINIHININCSPNDVPGLGSQVKAMIQEISSIYTNDENGDD